MIKIAPSILAADYAILGEAIAPLKVCGADYIHFDVMDGHFVPNITFGADMCAALKKHAPLPLDVHLMVENPSFMVDAFIEKGADIITFHIEAEKHINRLIAYIKNKGVKAGVALCPATPLSQLEYVMDECDLILLMSVNPGWGGQSFIPGVYGKIKKLRSLLKDKGLDTDIQVDGGINKDTAKKCIEAGATILVAGTAVFGAEDKKQAIINLRGGL